MEELSPGFKSEIQVKLLITRARSQIYVELLKNSGNRERITDESGQ